MVVSQTLECTALFGKAWFMDSPLFECFQAHAKQRISLLIPPIVSGPKRSKGDSLAPPAPGCSTRGGDSYMKQTGMLVVSLRGVNFGFWSRLGCSVQSANILSRQGLV